MVNSEKFGTFSIVLFEFLRIEAEFTSPVYSKPQYEHQSYRYRNAPDQPLSLPFWSCWRWWFTCERQCGSQRKHPKCAFISALANCNRARALQCRWRFDAVSERAIWLKLQPAKRSSVGLLYCGGAPPCTNVVCASKATVPLHAVLANSVEASERERWTGVLIVRVKLIKLQIKESSEKAEKSKTKNVPVSWSRPTCI